MSFPRKIISLVLPRPLVDRVENWRPFWFATTALVLAGCLQLYFPTLVSTLVDSTLQGWLSSFHGDTPATSEWKASANSSVNGLMLLATVTGIILLTYWEIRGFGEAGERAAVQLKLHLFQHLSRMPVGWFSRNTAGEATSFLLSDVTTVQEFLINDLRHLVKYGLLVIGSVIMMTVTSPRLAFMLLAVAPPAILAGVFLGRRIRQLSEEAQNRLAASSTVVEEMLLGFQNVKAYGTESFECERYDKRLKSYLSTVLQGIKPKTLFLCIIVFLALAAVVFFMWYGSREVRLGHLSPGDFTQFMFYLAFGGSGAGTVAHHVSRLQRLEGVVDRMEELWNTPIETLNAESATTPPAAAKGNVAFRNVTFAYPSRPETPALRGVSFEIQTGTTLALAGASGAGKSTIASLLLRFFDPDQGGLFLDEQDTRTVPLSWLRRQFALVPQEVLLYGDTLAANISYGTPGATMEQIISAARKAHADEFISKLPEGYDTKILDRGTQLSGGQRQRIALARAILRNPPVLILDEATSALDSESEQLIEAALEEFTKHRTTIIIAHRLSTVKRADRILLLKDGSVVGTGHHEELVRSNPYYRQLFSHQMEDSGGSPE